MSGTLRSTIDVFDEYEDVEIVSSQSRSACNISYNHANQMIQYEALRRVHLIPSEDTPEESLDTVNANVFRNLDSPVSEGGENFSTG